MSGEMYLVVGFAAGGAIFFVIGWLVGARRQAPVPTEPDHRLEEELRQQAAQKESELVTLREQLAQAGATRAAAEANQSASEKLLEEQRALHDKMLREAKEIQAKAIHDLREAFKALSSDALRQTQPEFLRLANETFEKHQKSATSDLEQRQEAIKGLIEPLRQQLETYQSRLQQSETTQADALGKVKEQLTALSASNQSLATETAQFRSVLKSNQARGRWGEETLRRVVEAAGMSTHCDFVEQSQGEDGKPDLIVQLPQDRRIIVDAKVPDLEYLGALDGVEPSKRAEVLEAHADRLRTTIRGLSEREYPKQFANALDHVVLFLPAESLFSTALEGDPDLIVWAESKQVYLATPASFIAVLQTINFIWQQQKQTENATALVEAAQELFVRVVTFTKHLEDIRDGLETANRAYNQAVGSYESRVRPQGERIQKLGGAPPTKILADLEPLESTLRLPSTD